MLPAARPNWSRLATLFDLASKRRIIEENDEIMAGADFWNDQKKAQKLIRETNALKKLVASFDTLEGSLKDLSESITDPIK